MTVMLPEEVIQSLFPPSNIYDHAQFSMWAENEEFFQKAVLRNVVQNLRS